MSMRAPGQTRSGEMKFGTGMKHHITGILTAG